MWIALESHGKILTAIAADKPVYVKLCEPLPPDQNDTQLWCFDRGFLINKQTAYVLGIKNDRLKDGESVVQATRRPAQEGMSQRWEMNDNKIYLRKKNELVLTSNNPPDRKQ
ncbi:hypothetical protein Unana1_07549 [Umbelopsis nana]